MEQCRICGWKGEILPVEIEEMMYGTGEKFQYMECPECKCLQIITIPNNLSEYYGEDYYSYHKPEIKNCQSHLKRKERILDVGCGAGDFLCELAEKGFENLNGCDPYIKEDVTYSNGVKLYKRSIHEMEGEYDLIYLRDSFEHMSDPHEVMNSIKRLLKKDGTAQIKIPVYPNIAYDLLGTSWYQLDAPRHLILYSVKGLQKMTAMHHLEIRETVFDSTAGAIICSFLCSKGIPYVKQTDDIMNTFFRQKDIEKFAGQIKRANENQYGDHAIFYLSRT